MTKRFTTDNGSNEDVTLVDNVTGKEYESNFEEIVDLLNEQHERIEDYNVALKTLQDLADKKIKENEQLKQQLAHHTRMHEWFRNEA